MWGGDHGCQEPWNFFKDIYMQIYILLLFGVVLGDGRKYILFSVFLLRAAGNPLTAGIYTSVVKNL